MNIKKYLSIFLVIAMCLSVSFSASASEINTEPSDTPIPFSFVLNGANNGSAAVELVSRNRVSSFTLCVDGSKDVIIPTSSVLEIPIGYTYLFEIIYDNQESKVVYNGTLHVKYDDNDDPNVVVNNIACNEIRSLQAKAAGTANESESNNTYSTADRTYDDYDNYGTISATTDVDWWVVNFSRGGNANFWLGNIPTGCDYDLKLYSSNGTTLLASSVKGSNQAELITYPVVAGVNYYVRIYSHSGSSASQYLFRTKNYPEVIVDRLYSTYSQTSAYRNALQYRMNCYGYAIHVYSLAGTEASPYKQQPGEFARDNETYLSLLLDMEDAIYGSSVTSTSLLDFMEDKIFDDFDSLNTYSGAEWSITSTTRTSTVPAGYRKIALTVGIGHDYHFYLRHSDGTWSHKPGDGAVTNLSFDTGVAITDNNIATAVAEGGYDDGVRYYLIGKSAIVDYPHNAVDSYDTLYTTTAFRDCAGDTITKATTISGTYKLARFDYANDIDYYEFSPTVSGTYTFTTSLSSSTYDVDMVIYNEAGDVLASDYAVGNPSITLALTANTRYYIRVRDAKSSVVTYTLYYSR